MIHLRAPPHGLSRISNTSAVEGGNKLIKRGAKEQIYTAYVHKEHNSQRQLDGQLTCCRSEACEQYARLNNVGSAGQPPRNAWSSKAPPFHVRVFSATNGSVVHP